MPIVQISRIQHRRGKRTDLPQLAAGELGWVIDEQRLFIGNGTVADGAPAVGNTEIVTSGSGSFTTALNYVYKGYLGDGTPIQTGASGDYTRTLQNTLDDRISVKAFGALGDDSTDDTAAIQRALDEVYTDTDKADTRARRTILFPAGIYRITTAMTIPPYAHLVGEGPDKTIIRNSGSTAVAVTEDNANQGFGSIGNSGAVTPTQIQVSNMTFRNTTANAGVSIDNATKVYFHNCKFQGNWTTSDGNVSASKGVTVRSTTALPCANIYFNHCQFTSFSRLVDLSYDVKNVRFNDCDFSTAYYGAMIGETMDGSSGGLTDGPRDVQFESSSWDTISQQAIYVKPTAGADAGVGPRNIISKANWYGRDVGNNFQGVGSINEVPVLQFDNDECTSALDFFERTELRRTDGSSELNAAPEVQGIAIQTKPIRQETLNNNQSSAATINEFPGLNKKGLSIKYKIERGSTTRSGEMTISSDGTNISHADDYNESNGDIGITLSAVLDNKDSTAGNETIKLQYTSTNTGNTATFDYQTTILA